MDVRGCMEKQLGLSLNPSTCLDKKEGGAQTDRFIPFKMIIQLLFFGTHSRHPRTRGPFLFYQGLSGRNPTISFEALFPPLAKHDGEGQGRLTWAITLPRKHKHI